MSIIVFGKIEYNVKKNTKGKTTMYKPEGQNSTSYRYTTQELYAAQKHGRILEGRVSLCTKDHNLILELGGAIGEIPKADAVEELFGAKTKDIAIISRVGKPVCFKVVDVYTDADGKPHARLSRRLAQRECYEEYIKKLTPGDVVSARITHVESFGCFADIGCGIISLLPIDCISVSRIASPLQRFKVGDDILCAVREIDPVSSRILLTHKELLGSWEENAAMFTPGQTAVGIIRSVEDYGIFVELAPNLAGLSEPFEGAKPGMSATVYIKNIIPERMKIKLVIIDVSDEPYEKKEIKYYVPEDGHIDRWRYTPLACERTIETFFDTPRNT